MGKAEARLRFCAVLSGCLFLACLTAAPDIAFADDHGKRRGYHEKKDHDRGSLSGRLFPGRKADEGNETTGQITAWSLAAANLTVALSLLVRGIKRFAPLSPDLKGSLVKFNSVQKKYLMWFHYTLNPLILGLALIHFSLSRCRSTALPEWGLLTMGVIVGLGIVLKFKLCPKSLLRSIYKVHTQPAVFAALISMLVIGHLIVD